MNPGDAGRVVRGHELMGTRTPRGTQRAVSSGADSDEQLMERVQQGDIRAFEALFEGWRARLFAFLVRRCGDAEAAEDLLQETWLRVVRSRERFDPRRRFSTWLFQIANNLCRDRARRREVEQHRLAGARDAVRFEAASDPRGASTELRVEMAERIALLPERLREVLSLRYYHDFSEKDVAQIVGIPAGTVKSRHSQAIRALRDQDRAPDVDEEPGDDA